MSFDASKGELIRKAASGDAGAFQALVEPYEKRLFLLCLRICGNREDAMDCAQEAMLRIWKSLPKYRFQSALTTWCYRIATNTCLDQIRKQKHRPNVSLDSLSEEGFLPAGDEAHENNPQAYAEALARHQALQAAIASLAPNMRAALVLRDIQELSYEEISSILRLPAGTVKSRINRAREKVRQYLTENSQIMELFDAANVQMNEGRQHK